MLVERFVEAVCERGLDVESLLVITYTERAAGELKGRIRARLHELGRHERPARSTARGSRPSTASASGCKAHPFAAGVDPRFRILDEGQGRVVRSEAFEEALNEFCADERPERLRLLATYGAAGLRRMLTSVYETLRSAGRELVLELGERPGLDERLEELAESARASPTRPATEAARRRRRAGARDPAGAAAPRPSARPGAGCAPRRRAGRRRTRRRAKQSSRLRWNSSPTKNRSVSAPVSRSTSSHWSRFVSWNSSTMIERKRSCSRSRSASSSRSRSRARSCRSSKSSADSRSFAAAYASAKPSSSSCSSSRSLQRERVERRLLDGLASLLEARAALRARAQAAEVEQALGQRRLGGQLERLHAPLRAPRRSRPVSSARQRAASAAPRGAPRARPVAQLEQQLASGRAQGLVDGRQHPAQPGGAVGREQPQPLRVVAGAELVQRGLERLTADDAALAVVEHAEARVEPGGERMRLQQPQAEAVDGRDPGAVERPREVVAAGSRRRARIRPRSSPAARSV